MKAEEFDQRFDRCEDVTSELDLTGARRPGVEQRRVNVNFPVWMIDRRIAVQTCECARRWEAKHHRQSFAERSSTLAGMCHAVRHL